MKFEQPTAGTAPESPAEASVTAETTASPERPALAKLIKEFLAQQAEAVAAARQLFWSDDYAAVAIGLNEALGELLQAFQAAAQTELHKYFENLPDEILAAVIGHDYLEQVELRAINLSDQRGLYLPTAELGGGDYLDYQASPDGRVTASLLDYMGHGVGGPGGLWPKLLVWRLMEARAAAVRRQQESGRPDPESVDYINPEGLFPDLDSFVSDLPYKAHSMELTLAQLTPNADGSARLELESTGVRMLWRDANGGLQLIRQSGSYPTIGSGFIGVEFIDDEQLDAPAKKFSRVTQAFTVPAGTAVFLTTDGLLDIKTGGPDDEDFSEAIAAFGYERRDLSHEEFLDSLKDWVRRQRGMAGRVNDDVTVLALNLHLDA